MSYEESIIKINQVLSTKVASIISSYQAYIEECLWGIKKIRMYLSGNLTNMSKDALRKEPIIRFYFVKIYGIDKGKHLANIFINNMQKINETLDETDSESRRRAVNKLNNLYQELSFTLSQYNQARKNINNNYKANKYRNLIEKIYQKTPLSDEDNKLIGEALKESKYSTQDQVIILSNIFLRSNSKEDDYQLDEVISYINELITSNILPISAKKSTNTSELDSNILVYNQFVEEINLLKMLLLEGELKQEDYFKIVADFKTYKKEIKSAYDNICHLLQLKNHKTNPVPEPKLEIEEEENNAPWMYSQKDILFLPSKYNDYTSPSFLEEELKNINNQYMSDQAWALISKLQSGKIGNKSWSSLSSYKKYYELRGYQIRVLYTILPTGEAVIVGAFQKKANNDRKTYDSIYNRVKNLNIENQEEYDKLKEYSSSIMDSNKEMTI